MSRASLRSSFSAPSRCWRAWSGSPRSIGSAASRICSTLELRRPAVFWRAAGRPSSANRRASSLEGRAGRRARALSSARVLRRVGRAGSPRAGVRPGRAPRGRGGRPRGPPASEQGRSRRSGRLAHQAIEVVPHVVLPGLEPVELGATTRVRVDFGRVGEPMLAVGQLVELAAPPRGRPGPGARRVLALELVEALAHRRQPFAGPAEVLHAAGPDRQGHAGARSSITRADDSASTSATCRAGRASGLVAGLLTQRAGELLEPFDQARGGCAQALSSTARRRLASQRSRHRGGPSRRPRGAAPPPGPACGDVLPECSPRRCAWHRRAPEPRASRDLTIGSPTATTVSSFVQATRVTFGPLGRGPIVGHAQPIR